MKLIKDKPIVDINIEGYKHVTWMVNNFCPFKCWYCNKSTWDGPQEANYSWEVCSHFIDILVDRYPNNSYLNITGGEPTSWPYLEKFIDKFYHNGWLIVLITNLSNFGILQKQANKLNCVVASYHPNVINTETKRKIWVEKVQRLADHVTVSIRLMMDPRHWDHCLDFYNQMPSSNLKIQPARLWSWPWDGEQDENILNPNVQDAKIGYTLEQEEILNTFGYGLKIGKDVDPRDPHIKCMVKYDDGDSDVFEGGVDVWGVPAELTIKEKNQFKGWKCDIGLNNVVVDAYGTVSKSMCELARQKYIGTLIEPDNIQWADKPVTCPYNLCFCDYEVLIPKTKGVNNVHNIY